MTQYEIFFKAKIPTCDEKRKRIQQEEDENKLMDELLKWFNSNDKKTKQYDYTLYSSSFLQKLKNFVEEKGYFFNHLIKSREYAIPIVFVGKVLEHVNHFIISTYKITNEDEFKFYRKDEENE